MSVECKLSISPSYRRLEEEGINVGRVHVLNNPPTREGARSPPTTA